MRHIAYVPLFLPLVPVYHFWPMLDDLNAMGKYAWAKVAYRFLCDSLNKANLTLDSLGGRGEISIMGCSYALQGWLLEHLSKVVCK